MTTSEFLTKLTELYGDFTSQGMMKAVAAKINGLTDRQRQRIFETYCATVPGAYKPDIKNVLDAMTKAGIRSYIKVRMCRCCGATQENTRKECGYCGYDAELDGDASQYYYEWTNKVGRFNQDEIEEILRKTFKNISNKDKEVKK